jgi:hypothetical protein
MNGAQDLDLSHGFLTQIAELPIIGLHTGRDAQALPPVRFAVVGWTMITAHRNTP